MRYFEIDSLSKLYFYNKIIGHFAFVLIFNFNHSPMPAKSDGYCRSFVYQRRARKLSRLIPCKYLQWVKVFRELHQDADSHRLQSTSGRVPVRALCSGGLTRPSCAVTGTRRTTLRETRRCRWRSDPACRRTPHAGVGRPCTRNPNREQALKFGDSCTRIERLGSENFVLLGVF